MSDTTATFTLPDRRVMRYATYGDPGGQPVIACHGAPACGSMFAIADDHARRFGLRLIASDRPGYGATPLEAAPSLSARTDDHLRLVEALGLDRPAIIGVSGGAPYATALAARLGPRARALLLVSPMGPIAEMAALPRKDRPRIAFGHHVFFQRWPLKRRWLLTSGGRVARRLFLDHPEAAARLLARLFGSSDRRLLAQRAVADSLIATTREAVAEGMDGALADLDIFARPWGIDYAAITARAVVWQGTADRVVPAAVAERLAALIPDCRLKRLEGAGHFWVLGRIREVLAEVASLPQDGPNPGS